jgi:hypothetical protein
VPVALHCTGCGRIAEECSGCGPAFDPPRFCGECGKRLTVQVRTAGWTARCNRCGAEASAP